MRAALFVSLALGLAGCPNVTAKQVVSGTIAAIADLAECAPAEYSAVDNAIRNGGGAWVAPVFQFIQCVPKVVHDIEASASSADTSKRLNARALRRDQAQRIVVSQAIYQVLGR